MAPIVSTENFFIRILDLNRKRRLIAFDLGVLASEEYPGLSHQEVVVLTALLEQSLSIGQLSEISGMEQSWTSRCVQSLKARKYIQLTADTDDARVVKVALSKKGNSILTRVDNTIEDITSQLTRELTEAEANRLELFFTRFNSAFSIRPLPKRAHCSSLHYQFNLMSRIFGAFGPQVLGTDFNWVEIHILNFLSQHKHYGLTHFELELRLPFQQSVISVAIKRLRQKSLIHFESTSLAGSRQFLMLNSDGLRTWEDNLHSLCKLIQPGWLSLSLPEQAEFLQLLVKLSKNMPTKANLNIAESQRFKKPYCRKVKNDCNVSVSNSQEYCFFRVDLQLGTIQIDTSIVDHPKLSFQMTGLSALELKRIVATIK